MPGRLLGKTGVLMSALLAVLLQSPSLAASTVPAIVDEPTEALLPGKFVWFELVTADLSSTADFYGRLLGWEFTTVNDYTLITYKGERLGGVVKAEAGEEGENLWIPSLSVADVEVAAADALQLGASVDFGATRIAGRGDMAVITDPQGARLALLRSSAGDPPDSATERVWVELWSGQPRASVAFYQNFARFEPYPLDTAPGRRYWVLARDGRARAGVAEIPMPEAPAAWLLGLAVRDLDRTLKRAVALGGSVLVVPTALEGPDATAVLVDPAGGLLILEQRK